MSSALYDSAGNEELGAGTNSGADKNNIKSFGSDNWNDEPDKKKPSDVGPVKDPKQKPDLTPPTKIKPATFWEKLKAVFSFEGGRVVNGWVYDNTGNPIRQAPKFILFEINPVVAPGEGAAAGAEEIAATAFKNITTGKSVINFAVGEKLKVAEQALSNAAGKVWSSSKDGNVKILVYNGIKYVARTFSNQGQKTMEIWKDGTLIQKYRMK
jgi:hypothetical protein